MVVKSLSSRGVDLGLKFINVFSNEIHWNLAKKVYRRSTNRDIDKYDISIDPFEVHFVSPDDISEITRRPVPFFVNQWELIGTVCDGDWDQREKFIFSSGYEEKEWVSTVFPNIRFDDSPFYRAMVERYRDEKNWFDTDYVAAVLNEINKGNSVWHGCTDPKDIKQRCRNIDCLYSEIKTNGYKTQREMGVNFKTAMTQEVMVDIGRNGQPLFVDGRHRLAIAKLLDLDVIPVTIGVRHAKWIKSRRCG